MIPCPIGDTPPEGVLPPGNIEIMRSLDYFIAEDIRSARRFLSRAGMGRPIEALRFAELNEHTKPEDIAPLIAPLLDGENAGMVSEAGVPGVADPGADLAALCHRNGIRVVPLTGPSSILLALMASGLNGQSFAFNGYLPVKPPERRNAIKHFERRAVSEGQTQIFIETPYRNMKLFDDLLDACRPETRLCVAADISSETEFIRTDTVAGWRRSPMPELHKRPAVFLIL